MWWLINDLIRIAEVANSHDKEHLFKVVFLLMFTIGFFPRAAQAKYGDGIGEPNDPYLIYTAEQMNTIGAEPNDWDKHFKLMADIDLIQYTDEEFNLIGSSTQPFCGVFDGNGHKITNFSYSCAGMTAVGLFRYVNGQNAEIRDLGLKDPNVDLRKYHLPDVPGPESIPADEAFFYAASLVGSLNRGILTGSYVQNGKVLGFYSVGGLVGFADDSAVIFDCHSSTSVSGNGNIGGLIGFNRSLGVSNCYCTGSVSGHYNIGGLIGSSSGEISKCYSTGNASGIPCVGGLVGYNRGTISNCYSMCSVSGLGSAASVGGLVGGTDNGQIFNCYSSARVEGNVAFGGLIGTNSEGTIKDSFWDIETSALTTSAGGTGKTTAEMKQKATFTNWDFVNVWDIAENQTYPFLRRCPTGDLNGDCKVDYKDFVLLATHWLEDNTP